MKRVRVGTAAAMGLVLLLAACGGGGGGGGGAPANPSTGGNVTVSASVFVSLPAISSIGVFGNLNPQAGSTLSGKLITGLNAPVGDVTSYDFANDRLYVGASRAVVVLDHASTASGAAAPTRTITPANVAILSISGVVVDKATDTLYMVVARQYDGALVAISHASTASGSVTPDHVYPINDGARAFSFDFSRKLMYLQTGVGGVSVYDLNALTDAGPNFPARRLNSSVIASGLSIDASRNRLYVASPGTGVAIMDGASSAGLTSVYKIVTTGTLTPYDATVDAANDRLYIGMYNGSAVVVNGASTLTTASVTPVAVTVGNAGTGVTVTGFSFP